MSVLEAPSHKPGDDLDGLLRRFFRKQLPHPWPAPRVPPSPQPSWSAVGRSLARSRWALAASVTLLLLSSLLLPSRFTATSKPENVLSGPLISDNPQGLHKQHNKRKAEEQDKPGLGVDRDDHFSDLDDSDLPPLK